MIVVVFQGVRQSRIRDCPFVSRFAAIDVSLKGTSRPVTTGLQNASAGSVTGCLPFGKYCRYFRSILPKAYYR